MSRFWRTALLLEGKSLELMVDGYGLTTANSLYDLPDYPPIVQSYIWQECDLHPHSRNCTNFSTSRPGVWKATFTRCGWRTLGLFALRKFQSWATNSNYTEGMAGKSEMFSAAVFPSNLAASVTGIALKEYEHGPRALAEDEVAVPMAALGFGVDILGPFMDGDAIPYAACTTLKAA